MSRPFRTLITTASLISPIGHFAGKAIHSFKPHPATTAMEWGGNEEVLTRQIADFDLTARIGRNKNRRYLHRASQLTVAAALDCLKASSLSQDEKTECSLVVGCGPYLEEEPPNLNQRKALWLLHHLPNTAASFIALTSAIKGESQTITTACSASLQAIGTAHRMIQSGYWKRALVGGGDSRVNPIALNGYLQAGALYRLKDEGKSYRPLGGKPTGFIPSEGAAFFLLEEYQSAKKRNAPILAEVVGFGSTIDGYNMTAPEPNGIQPMLAVQTALKEASLSPKHIDRVCAHGTGTPLNDAMESKLLRELFCIPQNQAVLNHPKPNIVAHKTELGHLASACGAAELAVELAQTVGTKQNILIQNFGFGGQNSALIIQTAGEKP